MRVAIGRREAVVEYQRPAQRRRRQRAVLRVCGMPGEGDRVADLPGQRRSRRVDDRGRRGIAGGDGDRRRISRALVVRDPQARVVNAGGGVGE